MKLMLINPPFNRYGGIKGHGGYIIPLSLCYLAAYAREKIKGIQIKILDAEILNISYEEIIKRVRGFNPTIIGITTNTCVFDSVINLSKKLKLENQDWKVVLGGPHPSSLPERSLLETGADFAVIGEGELTFVDLINSILNNTKNYCSVRGLAYLTDTGKVIINEKRELIDDLDILPFPARDLVDNSLYIPAPTKRVGLGYNTLIATSRGCPFNCGFCSAQVVWTRRTRLRKPEKILEEIEICFKEYNISTFNFTDELFTLNKKRVLEICKLIKERKLKISWVCSARAQSLDYETLMAMKEAGCREISFGIESGNKRVLKNIDKSINLEAAERIIKLVKKVGIKTHASYIIGYLGETEKSIKDTIRFAKKLNTDIAAFFIASPFPGTRFYEQVKKLNYFKKNLKWIDFSPLSNMDSTVKLPNLPINIIRYWHRRAIREYYLRPKYILGRILKLRNKNEILNLLGGMKIFLNINK